MKTIVVGLVSCLALLVSPSFNDASTLGNVDYLQIGKLMYTEDEKEIEELFENFRSDQKRFLRRNKKLLEYYGFNELKDEFNLLFLYGEYKELLKSIDWRGEEGEKEVEDFIEKRLPQTKIDWSITNGLREEYKDSVQHDGTFIIKLFKAVDMDVRNSGHGLLFFDTGSDFYAFIVLSAANADKVNSIAPRQFMKASDLKE
ncbi:MAG: hypothetical protein K9J17_16400 [Flavobacteriales bacterium]|nr:hypothetical protein [Flavobacteriales bacterium]